MVGKAKEEKNTYQAEKVEAAVAVLGVVEALENSLVLMELAFLDRDIDTNDILPDNATSANVQVPARRVEVSGWSRGGRRMRGDSGHICAARMKRHLPNFRVAHEAIAKTNSEAMSMEGAVAVFLCDGVHVGGISCRDRVALHALLRCDTPAIVHAATRQVNARDPDVGRERARRT